MANGVSVKKVAVHDDSGSLVDINDVCEDIETVKGVVLFLADVGCRGAFGRDNGLGISPEGEIGLNFILATVARELDRISSYCAANLRPRTTN